MNRPDIGVDIDDFRIRPKDGFRKAAELQFRTVEFASAGELAPWRLSASGRRHLLRVIDGYGLTVASLVADLPGLRLTDPGGVDERIERTCRILELAADLNAGVVTALTPALTHPQTGDPSPLAIEALQQIGDCADSRGVIYALRLSSDTGDRIERFFRELRCPSIGVCVDPASMVMTGAAPISVIKRLPERIALVHARDATVGLSERAGHETRFGEGDVDLVGLMAALSASDYRGAYIVRRRDSQTPVADIQSAREVLSTLLPSG